jgi:hypothetical protein
VNFGSRLLTLLASQPVRHYYIHAYSTMNSIATSRKEDLRSISSQAYITSRWRRPQRCHRHSLGVTHVFTQHVQLLSTTPALSSAQHSSRYSLPDTLKCRSQPPETQLMCTSTPPNFLSQCNAGCGGGICRCSTNNRALPASSATCVPACHGLSSRSGASTPWTGSSSSTDELLMKSAHSTVPAP